MKMKKSLIAAAVASVCAAPMAAQAEPELWGEFVAGIQQQNDDSRGVEDSNGDNGDGNIGLALDSANFGITSSEDLGNGLSVEAGTEVAVGEDTYGSGDVGFGFDNTYAALSGDFGSLLAGWGVDSAYYLHVQAPVDAGAIYDTYSLTGADTVSNALQYGYDGGAFQLTAEAVMQNDDSEESFNTDPNEGNPNNPDSETETFDSMSFGASFDAGVVTIGAAHVMESNPGDDASDPSQTGFSVSGGFGGFDLSAAYQMQDPDVDNAPEPTSIDLVGSTDFGGGLGGMVGFSSLDADTDSGAGDTTTINVQLTQALSSRTEVFGQLMSQSEDGGAGDDTDPQALFVGMAHAF